MSADVDESTAPEEGHGKVFRGGLDVLLVAGHGGQAEARMAHLKAKKAASVFVEEHIGIWIDIKPLLLRHWKTHLLLGSIAKDVPILGCANLKHD